MVQYFLLSFIVTVTCRHVSKLRHGITLCFGKYLSVKYVKFLLIDTVKIMYLELTVLPRGNYSQTRGR